MYYNRKPSRYENEAVFLWVVTGLIGDNANQRQKGDYINYLQMENAVIIPTFGIKEDELAVRQLETIFAGQKTATVDSNEIANDGGIINCITWNILK